MLHCYVHPSIIKANKKVLHGVHRQGWVAKNQWFSNLYLCTAHNFLSIYLTKKYVCLYMCVCGRDMYMQCCFCQFLFEKTCMTSHKTHSNLFPRLISISLLNVSFHFIMAISLHSFVWTMTYLNFFVLAQTLLNDNFVIRPTTRHLIFQTFQIKLNRIAQWSCRRIFFVTLTGTKKRKEVPSKIVEKSSHLIKILACSFSFTYIYYIHGLNNDSFILITLFSTWESGHHLFLYFHLYNHTKEFSRKKRNNNKNEK